ncbi:Glutathione S-transferase, N-terminal domain [Popillia japonica]|uniref:Glutathione S-transferase, N-terminal domain n=1 Tax=Popillia japonica TaxID=7064 RepID=A0AAW1M226_POPJA
MAPLLYQVITSPPCRAVFMLARAIGLTMDLENVNLTTQEHLKPEFLKLNPQHTVPVLNDDGFIIWDSHAINAYLISKYAKDDTLYPRDIQKRAIIDQRLHFDSGTSFAVLKQISMPLRSKKIKVVPENLKAEVREVYGFVEAFLEGNKWICGDSVTLADIHFVATISSLQVFEPLTADYPRTNTWLENCNKENWYEANVKGLDERNKLYLNLMAT